jgi:hypothetical protein
MKLTKEDGKFILEGDCQCDSCGGTGLYVGMAERTGAAVICVNCKGTGKVHIKETYKEFTERKKKKDVKRVYETAGGYCITHKDITTPEGKIIHFSNFGVDYNGWLRGEKPLPIEELHCPYQHTSQELQTNDVNDLYKNRCNKYLSLGGYISNCQGRKEMRKCWDIYSNRK